MDHGTTSVGAVPVPVLTICRDTLFKGKSKGTYFYTVTYTGRYHTVPYPTYFFKIAKYFVIKYLRNGRYG